MAADASVCTNHIPGMRVNMSAALAAGATPDEVWETLRLTSTVGAHSFVFGVPLLYEALAEEDLQASDQGVVKPWSPRQLEVKEGFKAKRGWWHESLDEALALDPEYLDAYLDLAGEPFDEGRSFLDWKTKELVYIAVDCAATHMFSRGLTIHIRNALRCGATAEEIMAVFELVSLMGIRTMHEGASALRDLAQE